MLVQRGHDTRRDRLAGVDQHFDPFSEAIRVELFVSPWLRVAPQVEVENRRQLLGCCRGDELSTLAESSVPNELMQRLGRKVGHQPRELRRIGRAQRVRSAGAITTLAFRHEVAMIRVLPLEKQS